jgi:hypothetical protein
VTPPAFVLVWPEPWLTPATSCSYRAQLQVIVIAARMEPPPGYEQLEALITAAVPALARAGVPLVQVGAVLPLEFANVTYQSARITVSSPVTLGGS